MQKFLADLELSYPTLTVIPDMGCSAATIMQAVNLKKREVKYLEALKAFDTAEFNICDKEGDNASKIYSAMLHAAKEHGFGSMESDEPKKLHDQVLLRVLEDFGDSIAAKLEKPVVVDLADQLCRLRCSELDKKKIMLFKKYIELIKCMKMLPFKPPTEEGEAQTEKPFQYTEIRALQRALEGIRAMCGKTTESYKLPAEQGIKIFDLFKVGSDMITNHIGPILKMHETALSSQTMEGEKLLAMAGGSHWHKALKATSIWTDFVAAEKRASETVPDASLTKFRVSIADALKKYDGYVKSYAVDELKADLVARAEEVKKAAALADWSRSIIRCIDDNKADKQQCRKVVYDLNGAFTANELSAGDLQGVTHVWSKVLIALQMKRIA